MSRHRDLREAAREAERVYFDRDRDFADLLWRRRGRASKRLGTTVHKYPIQRKRSDRTEAHVRLLIFLVTHCDLRTLEVGAWRDGKIAYYDLDRMAQGTGLSPWRLDRAISDLKAAGWIWCRQERERVAEHDGQVKYSSHVAVRKLTLAALAAVGISKERRLVLIGWANADEAKAEGKAERKAEARALLDEDPKLSAMLLPDRYVRREDRPAFEALCWRIERERPEWTYAEVAAEAARRLYPPAPPSS